MMLLFSKSLSDKVDIITIRNKERMMFKPRKGNEVNEGYEVNEGMKVGVKIKKKIFFWLSLCNGIQFIESKVLLYLSFKDFN